MEGFRRMLKTFRIAFFMSLVILSNEYRGAAFDLTRGKIRDQFSNPQCGNGTFVSALCERYNAVCKTSRCKYCVCNENDNRTTYFRNNNSAHGQCTRDFVIAKDSGCFTSNGGYSIHTLETGCTKNCTDKVKIWSFESSSNVKCTLDWVNSSFSVDNQYWKSTALFVNDFSLVLNYTTRQRDLQIQINVEAYRRWAGGLLKLQIDCRTSNAHDGEDFCVILKFTGKYRPYQVTAISTEILDNLATNATMRPGQKGIQKPGNQYLASTIALSGILLLVFVFLGSGIFLLLRKKDRHPSRELTLETDLDSATGMTYQEVEAIQLTVSNA